MPKLRRTASCTWMHEVGCIHSTYLNEGHWQISFTSSYCNHVVICTFYNAFVYKKLHLQPVWQKFAHQEQVGLQLQHIKHICDANSIIYASRTTPTTMDLIMMVLVTLWSPKCTLCEEVTSLVSSVILCKIMYFVAPQLLIHLQSLLECVLCCIANVNVSSSFSFLAFSLSFFAL